MGIETDTFYVDTLYCLSALQQLISEAYISDWADQEESEQIKTRIQEDVDWQHAEKLRLLILAKCKAGAL